MTTVTGEGVTAQAHPLRDTPEHVPGRWRALSALGVSVVLAMSTWFSGTAVIGPLRTAWSLSPGETAWLTIAVQLGFVAGSLVAALTNLLDVLAPRRVFVVAALGAAAVNTAFAWADGPGIGLPLRFATGFFLAGVYPTSLKILATWFVRGRGQALGILVGAITIGSASPHLVNALGGLDWRDVIFVTSAATVFGGAVTGLAVRDGPFPFPRAKFDPHQAGGVLRNRGVRLACLGYFGHMWELYAMWAWFLVFSMDVMRRRGDAAPALASLATFVVIAAGFIGCWLGGVLGDRWGRTRTTALAMGISGACAFGIGLLDSVPLWLMLAVAILWGISVVADSAQFSTMVTELSDPAYVGTALTLQLGIGFTLTVLTIWLIPVVRDALGWRWTFAVLVPGPLLGIIAMLRLGSLPEARRIAGGRG
ncbi:MAG TPA: MFS transporter [Candidatus Limnocylindria bacterium]|nr:MFS transporter [Candidatus Limnocylindria bacterium]